MGRKAVILVEGKKFNICCDVDFLNEFMSYFMSDEKHFREIKYIFDCIRENLSIPKYTHENYKDISAMKPFLNNENDRIICKKIKRPNSKQCIVMAEFFLGKKTNEIDKKLDTRYKIVEKYTYEIIESD